MPVTTSEDALKVIDQMYDRLTSRRPDIERFMKYFRGDQPLKYASAAWAKQHRQRYSSFADNWCGVVGSAPGERTDLAGFRLGDSRGPASDEEKQLWRDWELNEGPAQSSQGFLTSTVAKRSAVLVWGDANDEPVMTWEDPAQVIVAYDVENPRVRLYALKAWLDGDRELATLYTPDAVWKFHRNRVAHTVTNGQTASGLYVPANSFAASTSWEPREVKDTGDDVWPIKNPMGVVPIVEFRNRPMLSGEPLSDIAGTVAMQDAINLLWAYLFAAADHASMPARVVMGSEPPKMPILDKDGQQIGEKPLDIEELAKGRMLFLTGQNTSIGQWDAAKLDTFTGVVNIGVRHIAAQTRTPIYLVHGELGNVNGETLTGLDAPLVSKVREGHKFYTAPAREVFRLFALVRGNDDVAEACRTGLPQWGNPEVRSDSQISDAALKDRQIGWPLRSVLRERYGKSPDEIDDIIDELRQEQDNPYLQLLNDKDAADADADPADVGV